ncbi:MULTISPECIES: hemerythrin domain-containing protein [Streptomyces]|uniref:Hemerythrin domain-containing protein n=2 Tax=Streptomyces rimosus subsp. rimosus TaxID=132474 RepID=L8EVI2_STRR1|nr:MULTISPECIES: hemerythrin domain-containing protein [Streptomyces]MYT47541.1 hemerythrin domain-containing protein [Streptomyces sp. SID5471]KEF05885.1 hemerythrin [Streptomyces rimosus]KEF17270.1 hemerythrin [Streptomyces rimosus]QDA06992.1 hemerythrin domain-containing protein [Streptomyces rimosus]QEV78270.1 hemerythrin domain-containing protein [Streptomyces rimosus]
MTPHARTGDGPATPTTDPAADRNPTPETDVVALLMAQHGQIRDLFDEVEQSTGDARRDAFRRLVRMLAVHETAEEEVVHPYVKRAADGGDDIVADRLAEEKTAKQALSALDGMDVEDAAFLPRLLSLRTDVMEHARAEERYEFSQLRRLNDPGRLAAMAKAVKAAEAIAPTHPHPGVESGAANAVLGPMAAVVDRTRDAVRKALDKNG